MPGLAPESIVAIRSVGGLLPADLLERIAFGLGGRSTAVADLDGLRPEHYHLVGETLREAATQAWSRLTGAWQTFSDGLGKLPDDDPALAHTRERWLLPLFSMLGYGRLERAGKLAVDGKDFPISHQWRDVPIHLLGWNVELERKTPGVPGAATAAPTSLVQELLNRTDAHLWGMVSNGRRLLLLRDSTSLVRSSFVEFDLEAIFSGELFSEFLLLFTLLHQSRFERLGEDSGTSDCWAERWRTHALESGARALELLKPGVVTAINRLGSGFVRHPANSDLRENLRTVPGYEDAFHRALLRLVYRLLFVFVVEDRKALYAPDATIQARQRYSDYYSTARLRAAARRRVGDRHADRWQALHLVFRALGGEFGAHGLPQLGLPALGGIFESGELDTVLDGCQLSNADLLAAVRAMSIVDTGSGPSRPIDYKGLDSEELGSVYESLLEYIPRHDPDDRSFELRKLSGNERKKSGSYYTPSSLVECLLDSALDPVLDNAIKDKATAQEQAKALLAITVCDPACGSGHFLVAAARRIAKRLAVVRAGDPEPPESEVHHALHDVIGRCIYGVDINPLAIELAKVSLWLEAVEPGRPLDFLDAHLKVGNSLLGVTPKLLDEGIPNDAFKPIEGDDKKLTTGLRKQNDAELKGQWNLFESDGLSVSNVAFAQAEHHIFARPAARLEDVQVQAQRYREFRDSPNLRRQLQIANAWCAAFVWRKTKDAPPPVTHQTIAALAADPDSVPSHTQEEIGRIARDYRFFHWHLEFPEIFEVGGTDLDDVDPRTGWAGGFACVVGNPPWERVKLQEQEFFAARNKEIADAPNAAARRKLIADLANSDDAVERELHVAFGEAKRQSEGTSHLLRDTGRFMLTGRGDVNTYAVFAETTRTITGPYGQTGVIVPSGIATDATTQYFFRDLVENKSIRVLYDFVTNPRIWTDVGNRRFKFCILVTTGRSMPSEEADFAFFAKHPDELDLRVERYRISPAEIAVVNPNTATSPVCRTRRDIDILLSIHNRMNVLIREGRHDDNRWGVSFLAAFHMSNDSHHFRTSSQLESDGWRPVDSWFVREAEKMAPLYEAKMFSLFDHRFGDYALRPPGSRDTELPRLSSRQHADPHHLITPRYWVDQEEFEQRVAANGAQPWLLCFRDVTRATDERTMVCSAIARVATGDKSPAIISLSPSEILLSCLTSFIVDYTARQKVGGSKMGFYIVKQLPVPMPSQFSEAPDWDRSEEFGSWIVPRLAELAYTAWDMEGFGRDLGFEGPPYVWDEGRRELLRAELDAAYFHLYGIERVDVDYIMETFPIVKRKDEARCGEYRTKRLILEVYDAMRRAMDTGEAYRTRLDPPPGEGARHPAR